MLTHPRNAEDRLASLASAARPDFEPWHGNPENQPLPSRAFYAFRDATPPSVVLALAAVAKAARQYDAHRALYGDESMCAEERALRGALSSLDLLGSSW